MSLNFKIKVNNGLEAINKYRVSIINNIVQYIIAIYYFEIKYFYQLNNIDYNRYRNISYYFYKLIYYNQNSIINNTLILTR